MIINSIYLAKKSRITLCMLLVVFCSALLTFFTWSKTEADIPVDYRIKLFITSDGQPFYGEFTYTIECYGYNWCCDPENIPTTYTPEKFYILSGSCEKYGCSRLFERVYLNYLHFDTCNFNLLVGGQQFIVKNYVSNIEGDTVFGQCEGGDCVLNLDVPGLPSASSSIPSVDFDQARDFLLIWIFTLLIEIPVVFLLSRYLFKVDRQQNLRILLTGLLASTLSLPFLWLVFPSFLKLSQAILLGEAFAILAEGLIFHIVLKLGWRKAYFLSLTANLASFIIGWLW